MNRIGELTWISGPVARARIDGPVSLMEQVQAGEARLTGEVIALDHEIATIQVYEETIGLRPGEPLFGTGFPLSAALGPGLLGNTYDGVQRPLDVIREEQGIYIRHGSHAEPLSSRKWKFTPRAKVGDRPSAGSVLGTVAETPLIEHRILDHPHQDLIDRAFAKPVHNALDCAARHALRRLRRPVEKGAFLNGMGEVAFFFKPAQNRPDGRVLQRPVQFLAHLFCRQRALAPDNEQNGALQFAQFRRIVFVPCVTCHSVTNRNT